MTICSKKSQKHFKTRRVRGMRQPSMINKITIFIWQMCRNRQTHNTTEDNMNKNITCTARCSSFTTQNWCWSDTRFNGNLAHFYYVSLKKLNHKLLIIIRWHILRFVKNEITRQRPFTWTIILVIRNWCTSIKNLLNNLFSTIYIYINMLLSVVSEFLY